MIEKFHSIKFVKPLQLEEKVRRGERDGDGDGECDDINGGRPCLPDMPDVDTPKLGPTIGSRANTNKPNSESSKKPEPPKEPEPPKKPLSKRRQEQSNWRKKFPDPEPTGRVDGEPEKLEWHRLIRKNLPYIPGQPNDSIINPVTKTAIPERELLTPDDLWFGSQSDKTTRWYVKDVPSDTGLNDAEKKMLIDLYGSEEEAKIALHDAFFEHLWRRSEEEMRLKTPMIAIPGTALIQVLKDERYKTGYETGYTGGGANGPRDYFEAARMGIPASKLYREARPVYGFLDYADSRSVWPAYGLNQIYLEDEIKERSTFTAGDSVVTGSTPAPLFGELTDIQAQNAHNGWSLETQMPFVLYLAARRAEDPDVKWSDALEDFEEDKDADDLPEWWPKGSEESYFMPWWDTGYEFDELQVHGGVTLEDIESIGLDPKDPNYDQLVRTIRALGIRQWNTTE